VLKNKRLHSSTDFKVHIFVHIHEGQSVYLCGVRAEDVRASVEVQWVRRFTNELCAECRRKYESDYMRYTGAHG
jgi:hypothetical protein